MATIYTIAKIAEVSPSTVRRALYGTGYVSDKVRERVQKVADAEGYVLNVPARSLRSKSTKIIALSIPNLANPVYPEICNGVHDEAQKRGYKIFYGNSYDSPETEMELIRTFHENRVDGLILFPNSKTEHSDLDAYLKLIHKNGVPIVLSGRKVEGLDLDSVGVNSFEGTLMILRYLIRLGHVKIGFISGDTRLPAWQERLAGYRQALQEAGIAYDEKLVIQGETDFAAGYEGAKSMLLTVPKMTALFGGNDLLALGAIRAARELHIMIPEQLSVAGFDDIFASSTISPSLTTVSQPKYELGQQAAKILLDRVENKLKPSELKHVVLPCKLEIRESAASPPKLST